jgi:hypothetical protein
MKNKKPLKTKIKGSKSVKSHVIIEEGSGGSKKTIYEKGEPLEQRDKINPIGTLPVGRSLVGLSKGVTFNLGNYQSARIDCWISSTCEEDACEEELQEISEMIDEQLEKEREELDVDSTNGKKRKR